MTAPRRAVILVSGGLDSTTALAVARRDGLECYALTVDYGQRHAAELAAARRVAEALGAAEHRYLHLDLAQFGGSALTDPAIDVPTVRETGIPVTYVPARNTVLLSLALAWAEVLGAEAVYIGVNAVDYSGYPDCRPEFVEAFARMARLATKAGVEGQPFEVRTPLIALSKADIVRLGTALGVDYAMTVSCYQPDGGGAACGVCDACHFRAEGFRQAGLSDPTRYVAQT